MNDNALPLIANLIERTKNEKLSWHHYSNSSFDLKPIYSSPLEGSVVELAVDTINKPVLIPDDSFVCSYNNGCFFLLLYRYLVTNTRIVLQVQTKTSKNSKIYASSDDSVEISSQLKRLYNLVDSVPSSAEIDDFISDFIETE